jgi:hypothetical protein
MARKLWAVVLASATASGALAAEAPPQQPETAQTSERAPARPRRTVIHFGEDDIRGDITRPDGELVQAPRRVSEGTLLRIRRSFVDRALAGAARGE